VVAKISAKRTNLHREYSDATHNKSQDSAHDLSEIAREMKASTYAFPEQRKEPLNTPPQCA